MGKFLLAVISGVIATVIGGLILNQLQGKGRRRGDVPGMHVVASLPLEHATARSSPISTTRAGRSGVRL
jgi:hypothetical protein